MMPRYIGQQEILLDQYGFKVPASLESLEKLGKNTYAFYATQWRAYQLKPTELAVRCLINEEARYVPGGPATAIARKPPEKTHRHRPRAFRRKLNYEETA